jgi:hypothetical protein
VLAAHSQSDQSRRNAPKHVKAVEQPQDERHLVENGFPDDERRQHSVVDCLLRRLHDPRRQHSPVLHFVEQRIDVFAAGKRPCEDVGRCDGILDRKIDAHAADRRHCMCSISDGEEPRPPPAAKAIERYR